MSVGLALIERPGAQALPEDIVDLGRIGHARLVGGNRFPVASTGGVLLAGWAFRRDGYTPCERLTDIEASQIAGSDGAWAVAQLWGNYLLFWPDRSGGVRMLRAPVTGPPLFRTTDASAGNCAFTDLALARALGLALDEPDPAGIDAHLRYPHLRGPRTTVMGVEEILPGEIASLRGARHAAASWSPWTYSQRPPRLTSASALREIVETVVSAWSERFVRVQLELSGGIDSSIVAGCLSGRSSPWRAITMATADPDGDERVYARAVAQRAKIELAELMLPNEPADPLASAGRLRVRPGGFGLLGDQDCALLASARDYGADAIFSGTGGDGIFGYQTSIGPSLDAFRFGGPRAGLRAMFDQAAITGDHIGNALRHALRAPFLKTPFWPMDDSLLTGRFAGAPSHPWAKGAARVARGQRRYGLNLLLIQPFLDGYDRALALPKIAPLLSQPIVEFGLGVASWQWGEGGVNRALAREAFCDMLPDIVLARRSKGRILSLFLPSYAAHRARIRSYLLDGWLAAAGILDCDALDALLAGRAKADAVAMIRILNFVDTERWARSIVHRA